jgi:hypothetical protein
VIHWSTERNRFQNSTKSKSGLNVQVFEKEDCQMKLTIFVFEIAPRNIGTLGKVLVLLVGLVSLRSAAIETDPGWPRVLSVGGQELIIYQPQVDYWNGYTNVHFRCAVALKGVTPQEKFGVLEVDAVTVADQANRTVVVVPTHRQLSFPKTSDADTKTLTAAFDKIRPLGVPVTLSLDRVLAYLKPADQKMQPAVDVNLAPPKIFYSGRPAILLMFTGGGPQFKPVATNRTDLMFALNANWDLFYHTPSQKYYLLNGDNWLTAPDPKGPWTAAQQLPQPLLSLPASESWNRVRKNIPGKPAGTVPTVFVSSEPAEVIVTEGDPAYTPIPETHLLRVDNTDSVLFSDTGDKKFYFLAAGRWFSAPSLSGPWVAASKNLPADFARIPDNDPSAFVKDSVPGTRAAKDAVLLASVPTATTVYRTNATIDVTYSGQPDFKPATDSVQYAVNSPYPVFLVSGTYYCCSKGIWYVSPKATGPWAFCTSVPQAIYAIPPSNPFYNVTYVDVQSSSPSSAVYTYTAGYEGSYVADTGVLMFGAGMLAGAALSGQGNYYYPMPAYYSYGCGAVYDQGYGGYYGASRAVYGPYGGGGYSTAYNPATGTYSRSAYAYGPNGSASATRSYNPYTGTATASRSATTPYGTASQGAAYNARTGARAAGESVNTAYGSAGRGAAYNPTTGNAAEGGYRSTANGSAAGITTSKGGSAAAWNTANGQGAVGKTQSGDVYASRDGNVYKKDPSGGWSENTGNGWQSASKPESKSYASTGSSGWAQNQQSLESAAQSRSWGNMQSARSESFQRAAGGTGEAWGGGSRGGFGRGRR